MTEHELNAILARNPQIKANDNQTRVTRVQSEKPKCPVKRALDRLPVPRERESAPRIIVRVTDCRCRPLDADNFAGGCKPIIDCLRHAQLIPEDNPEAIKLEFESKKVSRRREEGTIIEIIYP